MFFVFLLSYRNYRERLGELEKAVEILAYGTFVFETCSCSFSSRSDIYKAVAKSLEILSDNVLVYKHYQPSNCKNFAGRE